MVNMLQSFLHMLRFGIVDGDNRLWIKFLQQKYIEFQESLSTLQKLKNRIDGKLPCQILGTFELARYKKCEQHCLVRFVKNLCMPTG